MSQDEINASMASMVENMSLRQSIADIPCYNGNPRHLKDYIQDITNGAVTVSASQQKQYVNAIVRRLIGTARDSVYGKTFETVNDLIKHLKTRFASGKTYEYYQREIASIQMRRREGVNDFYDRLRILLSGAEVALGDKHGKQAEIMIKPLTETALNAFIRGLPDEIGKAVDLRDPTSLEEALKIAIKYENRGYGIGSYYNQETTASFESPYNNINSDNKNTIRYIDEEDWKELRSRNRSRSPSPHTKAQTPATVTNKQNLKEVVTRPRTPEYFQSFGRSGQQFSSGSGNITNSKFNPYPYSMPMPFYPAPYGYPKDNAGQFMINSMNPYFYMPTRRPGSPGFDFINSRSRPELPESNTRST